MFLSYIYAISNNDLEVVKKNINSLKNQTISEEEYEIILISDKTENTQELNEFLRDFYFENNNCQLVENSSLQGVAVSWNTGIEVAQGQYVAFMNGTNFVKPEYVQNLKNAVDKYGEVDIIEQKVMFSGLTQNTTKSYLESNKVYDLREEYEPFAYTSDLLDSKIFKLSLIQHFAFKFRRFVRYDVLFEYKFLGQAQSFLHIDGEPMILKYASEIDSSVFDFANQWPHIFNYYRRIGKFRELSDQLTYSYYKVLIHIWLWWIQKFNNKILMRKAVALVERKFKTKEALFKKNAVYKLKKDETFTDIIENFDTWIKNYQKEFNGK